MRNADKDKDNRMTFKEVKHFLRQINVEMDDLYASRLFEVRCTVPRDLEPVAVDLVRWVQLSTKLLTPSIKPQEFCLSPRMLPRCESVRAYDVIL